MRRHGWGGSPPVDEADARRKIVEAAMRCVDRSGPADFTLSQVATELGVIRQTVYRYYPSTDELFAAVGKVAVEELNDELTDHLQPFTDPADWFVEALATTIELLPDRPYLTLLLATGRTDPFARGITSSESMAFGRLIFERSPIDWSARGYTPAEVDEIIEVMLRVLQSMMIAPPEQPRTGPELRTWIRRWFASALT